LVDDYVLTLWFQIKEVGNTLLALWSEAVTELERAAYGLHTLRVLHDQLASMNQFHKYPVELSWVKWEVEREETALQAYSKQERW
jgi:hypothetical protein